MDSPCFQDIGDLGFCITHMLSSTPPPPPMAPHLSFPSMGWPQKPISVHPFSRKPHFRAKASVISHPLVSQGLGQATIPSPRAANLFEHPIETIILHQPYSMTPIQSTFQMPLGLQGYCNPTHQIYPQSNRQSNLLCL